ncbi:MAG: hypothetical protein WC378_05110 [Opitutaceae bacterium]|jgi:hypothetical protein
MKPIEALSPSSALIEIAGRSQILNANVRGEFPRFPVPAAAVIKARVPFADAQPGDSIAVQAEDGGTLQGEASQGLVIVGTDHWVNVVFQTAAKDGLNRITLRGNGESRMLEFWVGKEPPVLVRK